MTWMLAVFFKTTAVLAVTGLIVVVLRAASAATRHLVWSAGIGMAVLVPVVSWIAPTWSVPLSPVVADIPATIADRLGERPEPSRVDDPAGRGRVASATVPTRGPVRSRPNADVVPERETTVDAPGGHALQRRAFTDVSTGAVFSAATVVTAVWAGGAAFLLLVVFVSILRVANMGSRAPRIDDRRIDRIAKQLVRRLRIAREVRFVETGVGGMPMTWGAFRPTVALPATAREWDADRIHAVLLHELAHVKRWDYLTQLLARVACAIYWFNPVVWIAARELRVERERACDDAVLNSGSKASAYAQHLLEIARSFKTGSLSTIASVAMAKSSQLSDRLLAVLDEKRRRRSVTNRAVFGAAVISILLSISVAGAGAAADPAPFDAPSPGEGAAPATQRITPEFRSGFVEEVGHDGPGAAAFVFGDGLQGCDWNAQTGKRSTSTSINDDRMRIRIEYGECELHVDADGQITFSDDERDVVAISSDGYLEIEERVGRREWVLNIESDDGQLTREWTMDGDVVAWGPEAEAWLANMLPTLFRLTGIDAEERAARIYREGGPVALLQEIDLIPSDHTARRYFAVLLARDDLDTRTLLRAVRQASVQIDSDFELAELLISVAENQPLDENLQVVYVEASNSLSSDHEHRRVLSAVLQRGNISQELAESMLRSAMNIDSDWEVAELLLELLERRPLTDALTPAFYDVIGEIDSDHERGRVIMAALEVGAPSQQALDGALAMTQGIDSDWEMAELLIYIADLYPMDQALPAAFLDATRSLSSDHELSRVLTTLIERDPLGEGVLLDVLRAADGLDSDHEVTQVLTMIADRYPLAGAVQAAYFEQLDAVDSDWSRGEILKKVLGQDPPTEVVISVLESALAIGSDFELSELLIGVARSHGVTDSIRDPFMRAADQISSSYERGRVLDAATPRR